MKDVIYQVKVTQEIPYWDYDDDFSICESSGRTEEYIAGTFAGEDHARIFAEALEQKIAEGVGFVTNSFTPRVTIQMVARTYKDITKEANHG